MKIYLRVLADQGYCVANLWSKHIKEQIIETVKDACDESDGCIGDEHFFPTFWQQDIHARRITAGYPSKSNEWLTMPYYTLSFVWEKADFDFEDDYYWLCDNAKLPYDFTCQPRINNLYTPDVYIGSYVKGQEEPLTLPGLLFNDEEPEAGEILADCMFVELKRKSNFDDTISQDFIDKHFHKGKVTLVYSRPAQGKTQFASSLTTYLNKKKEKAILYYLEPNNLKEVEDIVDEVTKKHIDYVVIDYLQLMRTKSETKDKKDDALNLIIKKLIDLAEQTGTTIIVMSQLERFESLEYFSYIEDVYSKLSVTSLEQLVY